MSSREKGTHLRDCAECGKRHNVRSMSFISTEDGIMWLCDDCGDLYRGK